MSARLAIAIMVAVPVGVGALLHTTPNPELERFTREAKAEREIKSLLRDPDSAQFEHVKSGLCGRVRARNGFGGMMGPDRFVITLREPLLEGRANSAAFAHAWHASCTA